LLKFAKIMSSCVGWINSVKLGGLGFPDGVDGMQERKRRVHYSPSVVVLSGVISSSYLAGCDVRRQGDANDR
jgi:hypothetical protein